MLNNNTIVHVFIEIKKVSRDCFGQMEYFYFNIRGKSMSKLLNINDIYGANISNEYAVGKTKN